MGLYQQFGTSESLEVDGEWFPYPQPDGSIIELRIARAGGENSLFKRELRRLLRKHRKARDIPIDQYKPARDEFCEAMAQFLVKDWRTITDDNKKLKTIEDDKGKPVGYSVKRAKTLLLTLPDLRDDVFLKASDFSNFQENDPDAIEKN